MKNLTLVLIVFISALKFTYSQEKIVKYYDIHWTEVNDKDYHFKRELIKNEKGEWIVKDYYANGKLQMKGGFVSEAMKIKTGHHEYYYENGTKKGVGYYKNNIYDGRWLWYRKDGSLSSVEFYNNKRFRNAILYNKENKIIKTTLNQFDILKNAQFKGGSKELQKYISKKLKYPAKAIENNNIGKVYVNFIINKSGEVESVKVLKKGNYYLDKEAIRVIKNMPKWEPAKLHNIVCEQNCCLPIVFNINPNTNQKTVYLN